LCQFDETYAFAVAIPLVGVAAYIGYMLLSFLSQQPTTGELARFGFAVAIWCD
jgi:hypothetical protein